MATDITKSWTYPRMDPTQEIAGLYGLSKAMPSLYGPNFDSSNFTPLFNNIRTAALMSKPHHCTHNDSKGHRMTRRCVTDGHQAYCLEWVSESGRRVRCGMRFKVVSGGCGTHPPNAMASSMNLEVKNLVAGKTGAISWGVLNDPQAVDGDGDDHVSKAGPGKQANRALLMQHARELEVLDAMGKLNVGDHSAYSVHVAFNESRMQREREENEQRRLQAAERKCLSKRGGKSVVGALT